MKYSIEIYAKKKNFLRILQSSNESSYKEHQHV